MSRFQSLLKMTTFKGEDSPHRKCLCRHAVPGNLRVLCIITKTQVRNLDACEMRGICNTLARNTFMYLIYVCCNAFYRVVLREVRNINVRGLQTKPIRSLRCLFVLCEERGVTIEVRISKLNGRIVSFVTRSECPLLLPIRFQMQFPQMSPWKAADLRVADMQTSPSKQEAVRSDLIMHFPSVQYV